MAISTVIAATFEVVFVLSGNSIAFDPFLRFVGVSFKFSGVTHSPPFQESAAVRFTGSDAAFWCNGGNALFDGSAGCAGAFPKILPGAAVNIVPNETPPDEATFGGAAGCGGGGRG